MQADQILVLEGGRVAALGTHAPLLARGGTYKRIYDIPMNRDDRVLLETEGWKEDNGL
jgi:ATP-binding cassette subfamily B protein